MGATLIEGWNERLFLSVNADSGSVHGLVLSARLLADWAPVVAALLLVCLWVRRIGPTRFILLDATLTALIGLGIAQVITRLWYHPRPFEIGLGHQFMPHAPEASFPSDHATLLFGLALPLLMANRSRGWGLVFMALGIGTAWARVFLGVHFPLDMLGGLGVAAIALVPVIALQGLLHGTVYPRAVALYTLLLRRLCLPETVFPRG